MDSETSDARPRFSRRMLDLGFITGLAMAVACLLLSGYYMIRFQSSATAVVERVLEEDATRAAAGTPATGQEAMARYRTQRLALSVHSYIAQTLLLSCGVLVGLAFGFLGFSLFLIGVEGASDAQLEAGAKLRLQVTQLAPGVFVLLCSTILIGVCVTREVSLNMNESGAARAALAPEAPVETSPPATAAPGAPPKSSASAGTEPL